MKVAFSGKGGAGKTTIAATLARVWAQAGKRVYAIDGDPNPNLGVALGIPRDVLANAPTVPNDVVTDVYDADGRQHMKLKRPLADLRDEFAIAGPDGVRLMFVTGLDHAGQG
jgi:CO dehydrogenase maturation factor